MAEKVGALRQGVDDPDFPGITYRRGASGVPTPVLRGTGLRVQTLVGAQQNWGLSNPEIAAEYGLDERRVHEALEFYRMHKAEIDALIVREQDLEGDRQGKGEG